MNCPAQRLNDLIPHGKLALREPETTGEEAHIMQISQNVQFSGLFNRSPARTVRKPSRVSRFFRTTLFTGVLAATSLPSARANDFTPLSADATTYSREVTSPSPKSPSPSPRDPRQLTLVDQYRLPGTIALFALVSTLIYMGKKG